MRFGEDVARVREIASYGLNQAQIARLTGVSRSTTRDWLRRGIQELFYRSCRQLGIAYTFSGGRGREISIARRESVARLDSFVGPKA